MTSNRKQKATTGAIASGDAADRSSMLRTLIGFACNQAFLFSLFYMGQNRFVQVGTFAFERIDVLFALLAVAIVLIVMRAVASPVRDVVLSRNLMWCYAFLMALGAAVSLPESYGAVSLVIEGIVVGVPLGCMLAAWGRAFVSLSHDLSVSGVLLATALAAIGSFLLFAASTVCEPVIYLVDAFPFLSAWALFSCLPSEYDSKNEAEPTDEQQNQNVISRLWATKNQRIMTIRLSRKALGGAMLFGIAGGLMETYASDPGMVATPTFPATLLLLALLCAGSLQIVGLGKPATNDETRPSDTLVGVYRLVVLVMLAGYLFIPVLKTYGVPGDAIVLAGYLALTAVLISLFILTAKLSALDGALAFSRGFSTLYLGEAFGLALGNALEANIAASEMTFAVASCAGLATLFAFLYLFTENDMRALSRIVKQADRFESACSSIAARCKLSKREAEILPLALRGRTSQRIAEELFVSKSTADTHLRRIYQKCGVHSRQELIDLGESEVRTLSDRKDL